MKLLHFVHEAIIVGILKTQCPTLSLMIIFKSEGWEPVKDRHITLDQFIEMTQLESLLLRLNSSLSNDVVYGLGAFVWTKDLTRAMNAVRYLRFGTVWVNEHLPIPSEMPWAGYKQSGHGASMSTYCLEEFTNIKHVYFDLTGKERKGWYYQIYGDKDQ